MRKRGISPDRIFPNSFTTAQNFVLAKHCQFVVPSLLRASTGRKCWKPFPGKCSPHLAFGKYIGNVKSKTPVLNHALLTGKNSTATGPVIRTHIPLIEHIIPLRCNSFPVEIPQCDEKFFQIEPHIFANVF